jgi:hypothetical protein
MTGFSPLRINPWLPVDPLNVGFGALGAPLADLPATPISKFNYKVSRRLTLCWAVFNSLCRSCISLARTNSWGPSRSCSSWTAWSFSRSTWRTLSTSTKKWIWRVWFGTGDPRSLILGMLTLGGKSWLEIWNASLRRIRILSNDSKS